LKARMYVGMVLVAEFTEEEEDISMETYGP
jgi:hypothetical protein